MIEAHIENLISALDRLDGDPDLEPDADDWVMTGSIAEEDEAEGAGRDYPENLAGRVYLDRS